MLRQLSDAVKTAELISLTVAESTDNVDNAQLTAFVGFFDVEEEDTHLHLLSRPKAFSLQPSAQWNISIRGPLYHHISDNRNLLVLQKYHDVKHNNENKKVNYCVQEKKNTAVIEKKKRLVINHRLMVDSFPITAHTVVFLCLYFFPSMFYSIYRCFRSIIQSSPDSISQRLRTYCNKNSLF